MARKRMGGVRRIPGGPETGFYDCPPVRIDIVVHHMDPERFTGGPLAIYNFANGLVDRGHDVRVVSQGTSAAPEWFDLRAQVVDSGWPRPSGIVRDLGRAVAAWGKHAAGRAGFDETVEPSSALVTQLAPYCSLPLRRGGALERYRQLARPTDVTIATAWETVAPVYVYGSGTKVHLMQHYEPYFADDFDEPHLARLDAELAHTIPMARIAQVQWIADVVAEKHGGDPAMPTCPTGFDPEAFYPDGSPPEEPFTVLTFGGGQRRWKGFPEAAEAIRLARQQVPDLHWRVYGGALLPPDNDIAPYEDMGFLTGAPLRKLYSTSHATLVPSWYEGFALPPIEAMACGSAVVATPRATADLARDGENAVVVRDRDSEAMADALVALWRDPGRRAALSERARTEAREYTWERSVARFCDLVEGFAAAA
jgi:glycosyltransferase involved in cell wall biosynthesis